MKRLLGWIFKWSASAIFINIGVLMVFGFLMMMVGCMHGDFSNHTISGSPALDSASMSWWLHWSHIAFWYFPWVEAVCAVLAVLSFCALKAVDPAIEPDITGNDK